MKANNLGGIVKGLMFTILALAVAGAVFFLFDRSQRAAYAEETEQMAAAISDAVERLDQKATRDELARLARNIESYLARRDADPALRNEWEAKLDEIESRLADNAGQLATLQQQAAEFPSDSTPQERREFEERLEEFAKSLNIADRHQLLSAWTKRKQELETNIGGGSATVLARTHPSGAKTYLDGEYIGLSSLGVRNVRSGRHVLAFELDGYKREQIEIEVPEKGELQIEPVELQLITSPVTIVVTGGRKQSDLAVSLEKVADDNKDLILYFDEKSGREVVFEDAPVGELRVSVTEGTREAASRIIESKAEGENRFDLQIE